MIQATFTVYPAIDLHEGKVVRLQQGQRDKQKTFNLKPEDAARKWLDDGALWLHVVNLDGAFGEDSSANLEALRQILSTVEGSAKVQFGGGLRDLSSIDFILSLGVSRVILGSAAVSHPEFFQKALNTFGPSKVVLGVDAKENQVRIAGWEEKVSLTPEDLLQKFLPDGLQRVIYTNIQRDGMESGVDVQSTLEIAQNTGLCVIASGGVGCLDDIRAVKSAGLPGVIVGKALYEGHFSLKEALRC